MSHVNELKYAALLTATGLSGGHIQELESHWLSVTQGHSGALNEMWYQEFVDNGGSDGKHWNENAVLYLTALGHTGSLSEMWHQFWTDGL